MTKEELKELRKFHGRPINKTLLADKRVISLIDSYEQSLELISKLEAQNKYLNERLKIAKVALIEIDERCSRDDTVAFKVANDAIEEILDIEQELQSNDSL
jgi:hypothetical protein